MQHPIDSMMQNTMESIRSMVDVNTVVGAPVIGSAGTTIIPISKISIGFGGGGSDFATKSGNQTPFGGGVGGGVKVTPICFLIVKDGNVRMLPVATPANTTADRIVEMVPDTLDKIASFIDSRSNKA